MESGFVVAHARKEHPGNLADPNPYERILVAAERGAIELVVPVFSFYEAVSKARRQRDEDEKWIKQLDERGREVERKQIDSHRGQHLQASADHLRALSDANQQGIEHTVTRLMRVASVESLTAEEVQPALHFREQLKRDDPWICAILRRTIVASASASLVCLVTDKNFADVLGGWSRTPPPQGAPTAIDQLIQPFHGLLVLRSADAVISRWNLA